MSVTYYLSNKKQKKFTVGTFLQSNRKIIEMDKNDIPKIISTGTSIKCGGVKLVLWAQPSLFSEMMRLQLCN
jgi:hypothetical protein